MYHVLWSVGRLAGWLPAEHATRRRQEAPQGFDEFRAASYIRRGRHRRRIASGTLVHIFEF